MALLKIIFWMIPDGFGDVLRVSLLRCGSGLTHRLVLNRLERQLSPKHTRHTNNTIRAARQRGNELKTKQLQERHEAGLLAPGDKIPYQEQVAYTSITQLDDTLVA
jgi:hypothetical protein